MKTGDQRDPQPYAIIGAAIKMYRQPGHGFLEPDCQKAGVIDVKRLKLPFENEVSLPISYEGVNMHSATSNPQNPRDLWMP